MVRKIPNATNTQEVSLASVTLQNLVKNVDPDVLQTIRSLLCFQSKSFLQDLDRQLVDAKQFSRKKRADYWKSEAMFDQIYVQCKALRDKAVEMKIMNVALTCINPGSTKMVTVGEGGNRLVTIDMQMDICNLFHRLLTDLRLRVELEQGSAAAQELGKKLPTATEK